jgi:hypothetical protein
MRLLTSLDRRSENVRVLPVIVTELELGNIQRHIFSAHFVKCADDAALENRPEAFDGLSVDRADDILASGVINDTMRVFAVKPLVARPLVSAKQTDFVRDRFADEGGKSIGGHVRDYARNHIAFSCDGADNRRLAGTDAAGSTAAAALIPMPIFGQAADESFIDLDNAAELIDVLHKSGSDLMAHEPRGPVRSEAHIAIDLQGAHSLLAGEHKMDDAEPLPQRLICVLENRSCDMGEAVVGGGRRAFVAQPVPLHCAMPFDLRVPATRAGHTFRPSAAGEIGATCIFIRECFFPLGDCHLVNWLGLLRTGHIGSPSLWESI